MPGLANGARRPMAQVLREQTEAHFYGFKIKDSY